MLIPPHGGLEILLQQLLDMKTTKNRLHLDIRTPDLDVEVQRVIALGAIMITNEPLIEHDWTWHILADPDGNELCVLQPPTDFPWPNRPAA